jgi:hypothetical protein
LGPQDFGRQLALACAFTLSVAMAGCGGHVAVHTTAAPAAHGARRRNFMMLKPRNAGTNPSGSQDFIVRNPATFRALSFDLLLAFQARGYLADTAAPDFAVAYYAAAHLPVDTVDFNYGYPFPGSYPWWHDDPAVLRAAARPDSEGTIIVDVVDPKTKNLLWRGEGVVRLSAKPEVYLDGLKKAVTAIVEEFSYGAGGGTYAPPPQRRGRRGY